MRYDRMMVSHGDWVPVYATLLGDIPFILKRQKQEEEMKQTGKENETVEPMSPQTGWDRSPLTGLPKPAKLNMTLVHEGLSPSSSLLSCFPLRSTHTHAQVQERAQSG